MDSKPLPKFPYKHLEIDYSYRKVRFRLNYNRECSPHYMPIPLRGNIIRHECIQYHSVFVAAIRPKPQALGIEDELSKIGCF